MTQQIDINKVISVYNGRAGKCCCGCSGKHSYSSKHRDAASKYRGYPVKDEEISDRAVKLATNKLNKQIESVEVTESGNNKFAFIENDTRITIVYFNE